jgi:hypothetical protein
MDLTTAHHLARTTSPLVLAVEVVCLRDLVNGTRSLTNQLVDAVVQHPPEDAVTVPLLQALGHIRAHLAAGLADVDDVVGTMS